MGNGVRHGADENQRHCRRGGREPGHRFALPQQPPRADDRGDPRPHRRGHRAHRLPPPCRRAQPAQLAHQPHRRDPGRHRQPVLERHARGAFRQCRRARLLTHDGHQRQRPCQGGRVAHQAHRCGRGWLGRQHLRRQRWGDRRGCGAPARRAARPRHRGRRHRSGDV